LKLSLFFVDGRKQVVDLLSPKSRSLFSPPVQNFLLSASLWREELFPPFPALYVSDALLLFQDKAASFPWSGCYLLFFRSRVVYQRISSLNSHRLPSVGTFSLSFVSEMISLWTSFRQELPCMTICSSSLASFLVRIYFSIAHPGPPFYGGSSLFDRRSLFRRWH